MASRAVGNQNEIGGKNMSSAPATGPTFNQGSLETQKPKASTYTAVEVSAPNQLRVVEAAGSLNWARSSSDSGGGLRNLSHRHDHCNGHLPGLTLPRVPGHAVIGRVEP